MLFIGTVPGSVFGFVVMSCDDDFFGIRNNALTGLACANGLVDVLVDGLVSLAARVGGDVTCDLGVFAPDGNARTRCFIASFKTDGILFDV